MNKEEQLILKYLTSTQNRLRLVIDKLTNFNTNDLNPTTTLKLQGESSIVIKYLVKDIESQIELISKILEETKKKQ